MKRSPRPQIPLRRWPFHDNEKGSLSRPPHPSAGRNVLIRWPFRLAFYQKDGVWKKFVKVVNREDGPTLERVAAAYVAIIEAGIHDAPSDQGGGSREGDRERSAGHQHRLHERADADLRPNGHPHEGRPTAARTSSGTSPLLTEARGAIASASPPTTLPVRRRIISVRRINDGMSTSTYVRHLELNRPGFNGGSSIREDGAMEKPRKYPQEVRERASRMMPAEYRPRPLAAARDAGWSGSSARVPTRSTATNRTSPRSRAGGTAALPLRICRF